MGRPGGWREEGLDLAGGTQTSLIAGTTGVGADAGAGAGVGDGDSGNGVGYSEAALPSQLWESTLSLSGLTRGGNGRGNQKRWCGKWKGKRTRDAEVIAGSLND